MNNVKVCNGPVMPRLEIETEFGTLVACVGGDPTDYPEIFLYIRRNDGNEIDLLAAGIDMQNGGNVNGYVYGNTATDSYTDNVFWSREAIDVEID